MINYLFPICNINVNSVSTAFILFLGVLLLSLLPSSIIRIWVFSIAFEGYSRQHIRKIRKEHTLYQKVTLCFLLKYENYLKTKKRIFAYWFYWIVVLIVAVMSALSAVGFIHYSTVGFLFYPLMLFDIIIWIIWIQKGKKII